jgi:hypothetical protein
MSGPNQNIRIRLGQATVRMDRFWTGRKRDDIWGHAVMRASSECPRHSNLRYSPFSRVFSAIIVITFRWREERACFGRALSDSNSSINYFHFSVFSVIWGICFSLKANPNGTKNIAFWHTFGTGDAPAFGIFTVTGDK